MCDGQCGNAGLEGLKAGDPISMGYSISLDPLESAIANVAQSAAEAEGLTLQILQDHLQELCKLQLARVGGFSVHLSDIDRAYNLRRSGQ